MSKQMTLIEGAGEPDEEQTGPDPEDQTWRMDATTRELGRQGVAEARAAVARARKAEDVLARRKVA